MKTPIRLFLLGLFLFFIGFFASTYIVLDDIENTNFEYHSYPYGKLEETQTLTSLDGMMSLKHLL